MKPVDEQTGTDKTWWTRAVLIAVRLVLVVFLLWALVSTRLPADTPVAEDAVTPTEISQSSDDPCTTDSQHLG